MASECELALRRSRPLFFLVGVHVILSFLVGKKRKNNGYEKRKTSDMLKSLVERCWNKFGMTNKMLSPWIYFRVYINRYFASLSMTINILRHSEPTKWVKNLFQYASNKIPKQVRNDKQITVTLNCLGFCFTKKILRYAQYDTKYSLSFWGLEDRRIC